MAIVSEISWDDMFDGKPLPESPVRKAFREAVETVAEKGRNTLPALNGRITKAVELVLNGDLSIDSDGQGKIASQTNGKVEYLVGKGDGCVCKDRPKAPKGLCKHILAYHLYQRASALAKQQLIALDDSASKAEPVTPVIETPVTEPVTPVVSTIPTAETVVESVPGASPVAQMHREAQSSANTYVDIAGRRVQLTLRDDNEERLLQRLEKLLSRFPLPEQEQAEPEASTIPPEGWCPIHLVQMRLYSNKKGSWWSHRLDNNTWCNGKPNGK